MKSNLASAVIFAVAYIHKAKAAPTGPNEFAQVQ